MVPVRFQYGSGTVPVRFQYGFGDISYEPPSDLARNNSAVGVQIKLIAIY